MNYDYILELEYNYGYILPLLEMKKKKIVLFKPRLQV